MNGIDSEGRLTTPDEQEAYVKENAMKVGQHIFILIDSSKFGHTYFAGVSVNTKVPCDILTSAKALTRGDIKTYRNSYSIIGGQ